MAGAALEIRVESPELARLEGRLARLAASLDDPEPLLDAIGAQAASLAQRRIDSDGPAPDASPWPEWDTRYARTRHPGHSLLQSGNDLLESIQHAVDGGAVKVGSNLVYAATHQFGDDDRGIPARAYLGLSAAEAAELERMAAGWAAGIAREALA